MDEMKELKVRAFDLMTQLGKIQQELQKIGIEMDKLEKKEVPDGPGESPSV